MLIGECEVVTLAHVEPIGWLLYFLLPIVGALLVLVSVVILAIRFFRSRASGIPSRTSKLIFPALVLVSILVAMGVLWWGVFN